MELYEMANNWVEWEHIQTGLTHCPVCLSLDKRWFVKEKKPALPQHPHCHCTVHSLLKQEVLDKATTTSNIAKYTEYLFNPKEEEKLNKTRMFEGWGYTVEDSKALKAELERQALDKYLHGEYALGKLDRYGQRLDIPITLPRKKGEGTVTFTSGWMADPHGVLRLATPYGDK